MEKFINNNTKQFIHIIQAKVRFRRIIQLIRNDPQMMYPRIKLFKFPPCDVNIQVNLFVFTNNIKNI